MIITEMSTEHILECVLKSKPVLFAKFGDGEYECMKHMNGRNCDRDLYTPNLANSLRESIVYYSQNQNCYLGRWFTPEITDFIQSITPNTLQFANYHTLIFDGDHHEQKASIIRAIHHSKQKKIIVCNDLMIKSKLLFNADELVIIPKHGWYDSHFDSILEKCKQAIGECENPIVITMAGLASKVLLRKLHEHRKNGIYLDYGSAVDKICTKRETRGWPITYDELIMLVKDFLPDSWNDPVYESIYEKATHELGLHLGR
jgi:hypothetical protein